MHEEGILHAIFSINFRNSVLTLVVINFISFKKVSTDLSRCVCPDFVCVSGMLLNQINKFDIRLAMLSASSLAKRFSHCGLCRI